MSYYTPVVIESDGRVERSYDIYSRLQKDRIIMLGTEVNNVSANAIVAQLLYLDSINSEEDIKLYINSPGGSITDGMAIYDAMNFVKADVSTVVMGQACSMGAFLSSAGTKGKRFILPNATYMIHQPLGGAQGQATDIEIKAKRILYLKDKLTRLIHKFTYGKTPLEKVLVDVERDFYLTAEQALEYGLIDKIVKTEKEIK